MSNFGQLRLQRSVEGHFALAVGPVMTAPRTLPLQEPALLERRLLNLLLLLYM